jgi:hypothetical protein
MKCRKTGFSKFFFFANGSTCVCRYVWAFREKFTVHLEEFKEVMLKQLDRKTGERAEWQKILDGAMAGGALGR